MASAPTKTPSATDKIVAELKGLKERMSPIEELLKIVEKPASRLGLSPQEFLAKMTAGGQETSVINGDGFAMPKVARDRSRPYSMGPKAAQFLESLYEFTDKGAANAPHAFNKLKEFGVQRVIEADGSIIKAALAEGSGITGGYTVPPEMSRTLLTLALEDNVIDKYATKMPMKSLTLQLPSLDITTRYSSGISPFLGGVQGTWNAEAAGINESEPQFRQTELRANQLSLYMIASNTLLADSAIGMDALITQLMSAAIRWYLEYSYLQGTGVGQPQGILNSPALLTVGRQAGGKVQYADLANMFGKIYYPLGQDDSLVWMGSQSLLTQLLQMTDNSAGGGAGRLVFQSINKGATEKPEWRMLGRPFHVTEKLPALGTTGDLILCAFMAYLVGSRAELQIDVSPHVKFLNNAMTWRVIFRGDGRSWLNNSVRIADGSTTVSPFIALAA